MHYLAHNGQCWAWSPKCGCTAVKLSWLFQNRFPIPEDLNKVHHNVWIQATTYQTCPENAGKYWWFVRNPYTRCLSGYLNIYVLAPNKKKGEKIDVTFREFVEKLPVIVGSKYSWKHHFQPQTENFSPQKWQLVELPQQSGMLAGSKDVVFDHKIHYDRDGLSAYMYDLDFDGIPADIKGCNLFDMEGRTWPVASFFDDDIRDGIEEFYRDDFEVLNHYGLTFQGESDGS